VADVVSFERGVGQAGVQHARGLVGALEEGPDGVFGFGLGVAFAEEADHEAGVVAVVAEVGAKAFDAFAGFEDDGEEEFPFGRGAWDADAGALGADSGVPKRRDLSGFEGVVAAVEGGVGEDEDGDAVAEEVEAGGVEVLALAPGGFDIEHGGEGIEGFGAGDEFEVGGVDGDALDAEGSAADERPWSVGGGFLDDVGEGAEDGVLCVAGSFFSHSFAASAELVSE